MSTIVLYQSILKKLGALSIEQLVRLDTFLSTLVKSKKKETASPVDILEEFLDSGGLTSIEDPIEWQREIRQDRNLPPR